MAKVKVKAKRARHWSDALKQMGACAAGLRWARRQETYAKAWAAATNPEWLRWLMFNIPEWIDDNTAALVAYNTAADVDTYTHRCAGWSYGRATALARCHAIRAAVKRPKLPRVAR